MIVPTSAGRVRLRGGDAVSWLTIYMVVLFAIPSRLVIGPLGSAGALSMLLGLGSLSLWLLARIWRPLPIVDAIDPVRSVLALFLVAVGASYAFAMSRPISPDEISPADVALISLASWTGTFLLTSDGVATRERLDKLIRRLATCGGLLAALGLAQFITRQTLVNMITIPGLTEVVTVGTFFRDGRVRPSGTAHHPLEYGTLLTILFPIALHVAFHDRTRSAAVRWFPPLAIGAVIAISSSRTAYLTAAVAIAVCMIGWTKRQRLAVAGMCVAGVLTLAIAAPRLIGSVASLFADADEDPSVTSRTDSFVVAWEFLLQHPFLGRGLGTFLPKYRIFDNQWLLLMVSVGLVGTVLFLWIAIAALVRLTAVYRATTDPATKDLATSLVAAVVAGFTSLIFFDAFAFPMTMGTLFFVLGICGALSRLDLSSPQFKAFLGEDLGNGAAVTNS